MILLTPEQYQELAAGEINSVRVTDPDTNTLYVVMHADVYERLRALLDPTTQVPDAYPAIDRAFAEGWNDPTMDDYDRYEELRQ